MYECMYVCMSVCLYVCVYVCVYVCMSTNCVLEHIGPWLANCCSAQCNGHTKTKVSHCKNERHCMIHPLSEEKTCYNDKIRRAHFLVDSMVWLHFFVHRDKMVKLSTHHKRVILANGKVLSTGLNTYATFLDMGCVGTWLNCLQTYCKYLCADDFGQQHTTGPRDKKTDKT